MRQKYKWLVVRNTNKDAAHTWNAQYEQVAETENLEGKDVGRPRCGELDVAHVHALLGRPQGKIVHEKVAADECRQRILLRVGVGALRFSNRDLAITLFGMTAMLLCSVEICVERQLICTTWPSMPPSTHRLSPGL